MSKKVTRLYEQFHPNNYQLELILNDDDMTFSGTVTVRGKKTGKPSERLTFHQKDLKITEAVVTKHDKNGDHPINISRINNQDSFDEVRLHSDKTIYPGDYSVVMAFEGKITRQMNGIYPCFFKHDGQDKKLIATQFESHHAREAFPCIDEPEAKATFDLTITRPSCDKRVVIANTPARTNLTDAGMDTTIFETTPKMSTYLLAFVYGEMDYIEAETKTGVKVRCYATPDNVKHTEFALDVAVKSLDFYNDYFDTPYPLEKCDFIALPDFASGAMENWGCITFREQALLVDPKNTSLHLKQYVANVVAHELTHQWFGNLVTMRWWTDLWLNESFASWMSWLAVDHIFPDWKVWTQFIVDEQGLALKLDALEHTHPIEVEVNHPDEIRTIFDAISYEKGASALLMLHKYLGANDFRDGLRLYLKKHAYGNTDTVDLWAALEEVSKKPVTKFMSSWTQQSGYPLVEAKVSKNELNLSQKRFYLNPSANKESATWSIPLLSTSNLGAETLDKVEQVFEHDNKELVLLNHDRSSFFRTIYNSEYLERIVLAINAGELSELDRQGLLGDYFESAKAGYTSTTDALKLLEAYNTEDSTVVWDTISAAIGSLRMVMDDEDLRSGLKKLVRQLSTTQFKRLGWDEKSSDSHFDKLLRPTILGMASFGENPEVVDEALRKFDTMKLPEDVHPDIRGAVYGAAARRGDAKDFEKMLVMHNSSNNSEERLTLAAALTHFKNDKLIQKALQQITSDNVRLQDAPYWIAYSLGNRHAKQATWKWLGENWQWLTDNLGSDLSFFRMPTYAGRVFSDESFIPEFTKFFEERMSPAFERPVKQAIETIHWQSAWKKRDLDAIKEYLTS